MQNIFYSYGYDPALDKVLIVDLQKVIAKNPSSVIPELSFAVTTYDLFKGNYNAVDSSVLVIKEFNHAGTLQEFDVKFDFS